MFKDRGRVALLRLADMVESDGIPESMPEMMGKKMFFIIKPKKQ
jgi:translation initiation factor IF-3